MPFSTSDIIGSPANTDLLALLSTNNNKMPPIRLTLRAMKDMFDTNPYPKLCRMTTLASKAHAAPVFTLATAMPDPHNMAITLYAKNKWLSPDGKRRYICM